MKKSEKIFPLIIISVFALTSLTSCLGDNSTGPDARLNLIDRAASFEDLSTFVTIAEDANLDTVLTESGEFTLFAPTNDAFSQLPDSTLDTLSAESLVEVLRYHISDTLLTIERDSIISQTIKTLQGEELFIGVTTETITVNDGRLAAGNFPATNGILHAIRKVAFPDTYLDVSGIIAKRFMLDDMQESLSQANLTSTIAEQTANGFTVFAPENTAFEDFEFPDNRNAPADTMSYHIIPQTLRSGDFQASQTYETLNGQSLTVEASGDTITINDSTTVVSTDLEGTNGVVHTIERLLIPPSN